MGLSRSDKEKQKCFNGYRFGFELIRGGGLGLIAAAIYPATSRGGDDSIKSTFLLSGILSGGIGLITTAIALPIFITRKNKLKAIEKEQVGRTFAGKRDTEVSFVLSPSYIGVNFAIGPKF